MNKELDPRIKKTRRFLRKALVELIDEKGFEAMTVRDLTERAEINRATFYQHYTDKYDLLDSNIDELIDHLIAYVIPNDREDLLMSGDEPSPAFVRLFEFIGENAYFFEVMLGVLSFRTRLLQMIREIVSDRLDKFHPHPETMMVSKDLFIYYVSSAHLGVISYWLDHDRSYSPRYMAQQLSLLTEKGPMNAIGLTHLF